MICEKHIHTSSIRMIYFFLIYLLFIGAVVHYNVIRNMIVDKIVDMMPDMISDILVGVLF